MDIEIHPGHKRLRELIPNDEVRKNFVAYFCDSSTEIPINFAFEDMLRMMSKEDQNLICSFLDSI